MKIILANGTELNLIMVTGGPQYVQGANRDVLTFVFDGSVSMDEVDILFSETNCETIKIISEETVQVDEENTKIVETENVHSGYVIRAGLTKKREIVQEATTSTEEVSEYRVEVTMAQRTYAETKIAMMSQDITDTQLALCEIYEGGVA